MTTKTAVPEVADLMLLFPQPRIIETGTVKIAVPVLSFGKLAAIMALATPILAKTSADQQFAQTISENVPALMEVLSIALEWPKDRVEALPPDVALQAFVALYEMNADFFKSRMLPLASGLGKGLAAQLGSISEASSSTTATAHLPN